MHNYGVHVGLIVVIVAYGILAKAKLLPSVDALQEFASMLNSKGGNILVLAGLSLLFFETAVHMTYWCLDRMNEGKLTVDNAVMMMGLTFITGSCFGGAFSSMLKVMSGENPTPHNGTTATTTTVATTTIPGATSPSVGGM